jgi:hypothetical protein
MLDFYEYVIGRNDERPKFYNDSPSLCAYDKNISDHERNIVILEFRGFRALLSADVLRDNEKLHKSIADFADKFF